MPAKLPDDCVRENRENEDAFAVHGLDRERLTPRGARRRARGALGVPPEPRRRGALGVRAGGGVEEAQGPEEEAGYA